MYNNTSTGTHPYAAGDYIIGMQWYARDVGTGLYSVWTKDPVDFQCSTELVCLVEPALHSGPTVRRRSGSIRNAAARRAEERDEAGRRWKLSQEELDVAMHDVSMTE